MRSQDFAGCSDETNAGAACADATLRVDGYFDAQTMAVYSEVAESSIATRRDRLLKQQVEN